ncbi:uncharacterized protein LOC136037031 [Artemia franciscana]|uniref:uncharacterized protein LOC136037031 n=1 Tax=Artemia franciscana TaxID=6661 RepID=UPI0032DB996B
MNSQNLIMNQSPTLKALFCVLSFTSFCTVIIICISGNSDNLKVLDLLYQSNINCNGISDTKSVISFSLYGDWKDARWKSQFFNPMKDNSIFAEIFYPDWQIRVYTNLPEEALLELNSTDVKFCNVSLLEHYLPYSFKDVNPRVWRFLALLDADINVVIFRDSDAIMLKREVDAVNEWLNSTKTYHVMRDHNFHKTKILAGMFGVKMIEKRSDIRQKAAKFISWSLNDKSKGTDQRLLANLFWDEVRKDSMIHDSFFCDYFKVEDGSDIRPFPTKRTNRKYIGNINNEFILEACPEKCRPKNHTDWLYC